MIERVHRRDIIIIMGDMNAKIGTNNTGNEKFIGKEGIREMNENGELSQTYVD